MKILSVLVWFGAVVVAGGVYAQQSVTVSSGGATTPTPGQTGVTVGTITLMSPTAGEQGNVSITSLPLSLTTGSGANASSLSNCQLFGPSGNALTTGAQTVGTAASSTTFTLDTPLQIPGGQSMMLSVRCNVASGAAQGGTYQFTAGTPVLGSQFAVNLNVSPTVRVGAQDTLLGLITLSAQRSGSSIQVPSIPLAASFGNGAFVQSVTDCRLRNLNNLTVALNNGANAVGITQGTNTIPLDIPLQIAAGTTQTLAFTCDVASAAPVGGSVTFSLTPSALTATNPSTGNPVTASAGVGNQTSTAGTVVFTSAVAPAPTVPGVPNTGGDMNALYTALLALAALAGGALYLRRT